MWLQQHLAMKYVLKPASKQVDLEPLRIIPLFMSFAFLVVGNSVAVITFTMEIIPKLCKKKQREKKIERITFVKVT